MALMTKDFVFHAEGIGVSVWKGNTGDTKEIYYAKSYTRKEAPFVLCCVRGVSKLSIPENPSYYNDFYFTPGRTSEEFGEGVVGTMRHEILADDTMFICPGAINEFTQPTWQPIGKIIHTSNFLLSQGRIAVLFQGEAAIDKPSYIAPQIFYSKTKDTLIKLYGDSKAVEIWRL